VVRTIIKSFDKLIALPKSCKKTLSKEIIGKDINALKKLFNLVKPNGKLKFKYNMNSYNKYLQSKTPTKVWQTKSWHCFELSLFLLACLKHLRFDAYYS